MLQDVLQVFIWTFALGAALAIPMSVRKSAFLCIGWLAVYALAYWYLSMNGHYAQDSLAADGNWMPMHCEKIVLHGTREVPKLNGMGAFFGPLVWIDRLTIHRPKTQTPPVGLQEAAKTI
jgi:hypothetical protein